MEITHQMFIMYYTDAHPARSKWWDFGEIYEEEIDRIKVSVRRFLLSYLKYENRNRTVPWHPESWSNWFNNHCDEVFDAVWFHNLPKISNSQSNYPDKPV